MNLLLNVISVDQHEADDCNNTTTAQLWFNVIAGKLTRLRSYHPVRSSSHQALQSELSVSVNPYPTAFPYGNGMVLHFYQQQESSTTKTVHKVINKGLKAYV